MVASCPLRQKLKKRKTTINNRFYFFISEINKRPTFLLYGRFPLSNRIGSLSKQLKNIMRETVQRIIARAHDNNTISRFCVTLYEG